MTNRKWLVCAMAATLTTALVSGCSQTAEKPELLEGTQASLVDQQTPSVKPVEVSASASTNANLMYRPLDTALAAESRRTVVFSIGDDTPANESESNTALYNPGQPHNKAPSYPERPVPTRGATRQQVLAALGTPPNTLPGGSGKEVWDYGTYRIFFSDDTVAFTQVW